MNIPEQYENHADEWREEEAERRHAQKYVPWIDPRDPDYIGPEEDDAE